MFCTTCNQMINVKRIEGLELGCLSSISWSGRLMLGHLKQHSNKYFSLVTHDLTVSMHTLLPLPCHILWCKYDAHVAWLYFLSFIDAIFILDGPLSAVLYILWVRILLFLFLFVDSDDQNLHTDQVGNAESMNRKRNSKICTHTRRSSDLTKHRGPNTWIATNISIRTWILLGQKRRFWIN